MSNESKMNAPVDVLAVMDADAAAADQWRQQEAGERDAAKAEAMSRVARAELAGLMRDIDIVADALSQDGRGPAGMTKEVAAKRLRAALARLGGAA